MRNKGFRGNVILYSFLVQISSLVSAGSAGRNNLSDILPHQTVGGIPSKNVHTKSIRKSCADSTGQSQCRWALNYSREYMQKEQDTFIFSMSSISLMAKQTYLSQCREFLSSCLLSSLWCWFCSKAGCPHASKVVASTF